MKNFLNKKIKYIITGLILIIMINIAISFAYIRGTTLNNESLSTVALTGGRVNVKYSSNSPDIIANDILPGFETTKQFTVTSEYGDNHNYYKDSLWYTIAIVVDKNEFDDGSIICSVTADESSDNDGILPKSSNISIPSGNNQNGIHLASGRFDSDNMSHIYILKISYPETGENQSHLVNSEFQAHVILINPQLINITFDLDGGSFENLKLNSNSTMKAAANSAINLPIPNKVGYIFAGWERVSGDVGVNSTVITTGSNDITLKALWSKGDFDYTGGEQEFIAKLSGYYKIEAWGAKGADYYPKYGTVGGKGAYTSGIIYLNKGNKLYVYVGEEGINAGIDRGYGSYGFNGGSGGNYTCYNYNSGKGAYNFYGGGATDIRLLNGEWNDFESLKSRIMVAAGGASANQNANGVPGGGVLGKDGGSGKGATQISSGGPKAGGFGYAAVPTKNATVCDDSCAAGAGSGYYGGGASNKTGTGIGMYSAGSGSSFVSGHSGCNAISEVSTSTNIIHTNQSEHYSDYVFTDTIIKAGNEEMPAHNGIDETMIGNDGPGYVRITYISE